MSCYYSYISYNAFVGSIMPKSRNKETVRPNVVSIRLNDKQMSRLKRLSRKFGKSPSETSVALIEESLRRLDFAGIDFRDSIVGRQAYVQGQSLAVWEVIEIAAQYGRDVVKTAKHLSWTPHLVQVALNYEAAYPDEIKDRIDESKSFDFSRLLQLVPKAEKISLARATKK